MKEDHHGEEGQEGNGEEVSEARRHRAGIRSEWL
jgi:hypothetical protein